MIWIHGRILLHWCSSFVGEDRTTLDRASAPVCSTVYQCLMIIPEALLKIVQMDQDIDTGKSIFGCTVGRFVSPMRTSFWHHVWVGSKPLEDYVAPLLFKLSKNKGQLILMQT